MTRWTTVDPDRGDDNRKIGRTPTEKGYTEKRGAYNLISVPSDHSETYTLYRQGLELLEDGDFEQATVPLAEAARRAPEKSSVREALGRAYFRSAHYAEAATEFEAVVETHPVNDFAQFCLGRALSLMGNKDRARHHLAIASCLRPERKDYRVYRQRIS